MPSGQEVEVVVCPPRCLPAKHSLWWCLDSLVASRHGYFDQITIYIYIYVSLANWPLLSPICYASARSLYTSKAVCLWTFVRYSSMPILDAQDTLDQDLASLQPTTQNPFIHWKVILADSLSLNGNCWSWWCSSCIIHCQLWNIYCWRLPK